MASVSSSEEPRVTFNTWCEALDPGGHLPWNAIDQGLSSASTLLFALIAAHYAISGFSQTALLLIVYSLIIGAGRCLFGDALLIYSAQLGDLRVAIRYLLSDVFAAGLAIGVPCAIVGVALGGRYFMSLGLFALALPMLLVQDAARYVFFAQDVAWRAAIADGAWLLVQGGIVALLLFIPVLRTSTTVEVSWLAGAASSTVLEMLVLRVAPKLGIRFRWLRRTWRLAVPSLAEFMAVVGATQIALLALMGVIGSDAIAAWRAALLLLGPVTVLVVASTVSLERRGSKMVERDGSVSRSLTVGTGIALTAIVCGVGVAWLVIPGAGPLALGPEWGAAQHFMLAALVFVIAGLWTTLGMITIRLRNLQWKSLAARVAISPLYIVCPAAARSAWGPLGCLSALAGVVALDAVVIWLVLGSQRTPIGRHRRSDPFGKGQSDQCGWLGTSEPPSQWPGTAGSSASASRSEMLTVPGIPPRRSAVPRFLRQVRPDRRRRASSRRNSRRPWTNSDW